jgi:hypothetical protein
MTEFFGDAFRILDRLNLTPFVRRTLSVCRQIGQPEKRRPAKFTIAGVPSGAFDKSQSAQFTLAAGDVGPIANSEVLEIPVRHRQLAVVPPAMVGELDLDAGKDSMSGQAQHTESRRPQHFAQARGKLAADLVVAAFLLHTTPLRFA